jgi:transposase
MERKAYPTDVHEDEWALVAPSLTLMTEDAPQRDHSLREVFNGQRWLVRAGAAWRLMPHDLPPWHTVYQQSQRWRKAGVFAAIVHDLRELLRVAQGRNAQPSAAIVDSRTLQSPPASGTRAGDDGAKRRRGSTVHMAVETLGHRLARTSQPPTSRTGARARPWLTRGKRSQARRSNSRMSTKGIPAQTPPRRLRRHLQLEVVKLPEAKKGLVLLPKRWVVERSNAWAARFRRLARDYEPLAETLKGLHCVAFAILMLKRFVELILYNA